MVGGDVGEVVGSYRPHRDPVHQDVSHVVAEVRGYGVGLGASVVDGGVACRGDLTRWRLAVAVIVKVSMAKEAEMVWLAVTSLKS